MTRCSKDVDYCRVDLAETVELKPGVDDCVSPANAKELSLTPTLTG